MKRIIEENILVVNTLKETYDIFHYCINGNYDKIKLYIELGFDVNRKDNENYQTLLEYASVNGHYNIVKLLIDNGANPNIYNKGVDSPYFSVKKIVFIK